MELARRWPADLRSCRPLIGHPFTSGPSSGQLAERAPEQVGRGGQAERCAKLAPVYGQGRAAGWLRGSIGLHATSLRNGTLHADCPQAEVHRRHRNAFSGRQSEFDLRASEPAKLGGRRTRTFCLKLKHEAKFWPKSTLATADRLLLRHCGQVNCGRPIVVRRPLVLRPAVRYLAASNYILRSLARQSVIHRHFRLQFAAEFWGELEANVAH